MYNPISHIWHSLPHDIEKRMEICIKGALAERVNKNDVILFFRADGVGVPGKLFSRLLDIFIKHNTPLSLAVVPSWLYESRWDIIKSTAHKKKSLFCWHQNGWKHTNYEDSEVKQEFGPARSISEIIDDLEKGWVRLESVLGDDFYPAFTPPWNMCSETTLQLIRELKYNSISRFHGISPKAPNSLPEFPVNIDLHTRKETDPLRDWKKLINEIKATVSYGYCGIMLHHKYMNDNAFDFLELFLNITGRYKNIRPANLKTMAEI